MKKNILLLALLCSVATSLLAVSPDSAKANIPSYVKVATWYNFNKAAYSLTFDDGLLTQSEYLEPILAKYGLKATFFLITNSLQDNPDQLPQWRFGYWHKFIAMANTGHELGSHTATHPKLTSLKDGGENTIGTLQYELTEPVRAIQERIPGYKVISFAYPYVDYNTHVKEESLKRYPAVRAAGEAPNSLETIQWGALQANSLTYSGTRTVASDIQKMTLLQNYLEEGLIAEGNWGLYLAHDVMPLEIALKASDSWQPVSSESFEQFAIWLKKKQDAKELWVAPMGAVTRYIKEKENLEITEKEKTDTKLSLLLNDQLPDEIYDQALTLEIQLPQGWKKVKIQQGRKKETLSAKEGKIIVQAVPGKELLEITKLE